MNTSKAYAAIFAAADPIVTHWRPDLTKHDRRTIEDAGDGMPFLHFTGDTGTDLMMMPPADHPEWPNVGERVPFIFGHADRDHILHQKIVSVECMPRINRPIAHHWDGHRLKRIDMARALDIVNAYAAKVARAWKKAAA